MRVGSLWLPSLLLAACSSAGEETSILSCAGTEGHLFHLCGWGGGGGGACNCTRLITTIQTTAKHNHGICLSGITKGVRPLYSDAQCRMKLLHIHRALIKTYFQNSRLMLCNFFVICTKIFLSMLITKCVCVAWSEWECSVMPET